MCKSDLVIGGDFYNTDYKLFKLLDDGIFSRLKPMTDYSYLQDMLSSDIVKSIVIPNVTIFSCSPGPHFEKMATRSVQGTSVTIQNVEVAP